MAVIGEERGRSPERLMRRGRAGSMVGMKRPEKRGKQKRTSVLEPDIRVDGGAWNPAVGACVRQTRARREGACESVQNGRRSRDDEHARGSFYATLALPCSGGSSVVRKYCTNRRSSSRSVGERVARAGVGSGNDSAWTAS